MNAADIELLRAERDFLLRSLDDLDNELTANEITVDRHRQLSDHYTARAADILRALKSSPAPSETEGAPTPSGRRWPLPALLIAVVAALTAFLLPSALSDRPQGSTITGNEQSRPDDLTALKRSVDERPSDVSAHLAYARALLGERKPVEALEHYDEAARLDPGNAEAHAYGGWILHLAGMSDEALPRLDRATAADPGFPDGHFFRGMVLRDSGRTEEAAEELRSFLALSPPELPLRAQVEAVLAEVADAPTTTSTPDPDQP